MSDADFDEILDWLFSERRAADVPGDQPARRAYNRTIRFVRAMRDRQKEQSNG